MKNNALIICSCLMIAITACKSSSFMKNADETRISIKQYLVEPVYVFQITKEKLNIYENYRVVKNNGKTKVKYVHKYSIDLTKKQIVEIDNYLMKILRLESEYVKPTIGGIAWDISIDIKGTSKAILIANKVVPEIFEIFDYINELIPSGKPKIRIDILSD
jgi:hypothetical protein